MAPAEGDVNARQDGEREPTSQDTAATRGEHEPQQPQRDSATSDPEQIRRDIEHSRQRMDLTLAALSERVSMQHLFQGTMKMMHEHAGTWSRQLLTGVRENQIPLAVTATGLSWLIYSSVRPRRSGEAGHSEAEQPSAYDAELKARAHLYEAGMESQGSAFEDQWGTGPGRESQPPSEESFEPSSGGLSSSASELSHRLHERTQQLGQRVGEQARQARGRLRQTYDRASAPVRQRANEAQQAFHEHPMMLGLAILGAGVLAGLAVPSTRAQRRALSGMRERAIEQADDYAQELAQRGQQAVEQASDTARQAAEQAAEQSAEQLGGRGGSSSHASR